MKKRFNFKGLPSAKELEQRTILMFVNTDNAVDHPEPLQPNMIQVGGLQISEARALPLVRTSVNFVFLINGIFQGNGRIRQ